MDQVVFREDPLSRLDTASTYQEKLSHVHRALKKRCPGIDRVSVALYDVKARTLKTFIASPDSESPLKNYECKLADDSSLLELARNTTVRIIHDLSIYEDHDTIHSRSILGHGYASSYTHPLYFNRKVSGFLFFDSFQNRYFRDRILEHIEIFVHMLNEMIMNDLAATRALVAAMRTSVSMVHKHDMETGNHLERMTRYTRLIARYLVKQGLETLNDEQIEQVTLFSSLHDIGKIGIPDKILKKPDRLNEEERQVMNTHATQGRQIIDEMINYFGFERVPYISDLRDIVELHHEAMDGSGYPHGFHGKDISIAARIVAVSDIFDALTSQRPYKPAWANDHAFALLRLMSIDKLDKGCVSALVDNPLVVSQIQKQFAEENSHVSTTLM